MNSRQLDLDLIAALQQQVEAQDSLLKAYDALIAAQNRRIALLEDLCSIKGVSLN